MCSKNLEDLRKRQKLDKLLLFLFSVNLYLCVYNFLISFLTFFSLLNFRKQSHKLLTISSSSSFTHFLKYSLLRTQIFWPRLLS